MIFIYNNKKIYNCYELTDSKPFAILHHKLKFLIKFHAKIKLPSHVNGSMSTGSEYISLNKNKYLVRGSINQPDHLSTYSDRNEIIYVFQG